MPGLPRHGRAEVHFKRDTTVSLPEELMCASVENGDVTPMCWA